MPLINRISRLFAADLHAVLDRIEEPDVLLRQSIREMEEEFSAMQTRLATIANEAQRNRTKVKDLELQQSTIAEERALCLDANEESLARDLVRRRLENERRISRLIGTREHLEQERKTLADTLSDSEQKLVAVRQKLELLGDADHQPAVDEPAVGEAEVEIALLRAKYQRAGS